jgi:hypothetical protein
VSLGAQNPVTGGREAPNQFGTLGQPQGPSGNGGQTTWPTPQPDRGKASTANAQNSAARVTVAGPLAGILLILSPVIAAIAMRGWRRGRRSDLANR